mmetsp:Transcript_61709/g.93140  ORF Transcript_61709/g.93140 Transcript_61709/m.93140 type:complete len:96 (+) Transcript_61709:113-400(+)
MWLVQTMPPQASLQALTSSAATNASLLWLASFQILDGLLLCVRCGCSSTADNLTATGPPDFLDLHRELNGVGSRLGAQVVHTRLQAQLPAMEMHG